MWIVICNVITNGLVIFMLNFMDMGVELMDSIHYYAMPIFEKKKEENQRANIPINIFIFIGVRECVQWH